MGDPVSRVMVSKRTFSPWLPSTPAGVSTQRSTKTDPSVSSSQMQDSSDGLRRYADLSGPPTGCRLRRHGANRRRPTWTSRSFPSDPDMTNSTLVGGSWGWFCASRFWAPEETLHFRTSVRTVRGAHGRRARGRRARGFQVSY